MAKPDQQDNLYAMRHSLAHITANAVQHLWPEARFGVGPVVEHGFYYDIDLDGQRLTEADFDRIEAEMRRIIAADEPFEHFMMSVQEAVAWATAQGQPYKQELLNDLQRAGTTVAHDLDSAELGLPATDSKVQEVSFYRNGDFTDLCRGPHVASTGQTGAFKLMRVSGAYWRGKEGNPQMQRIYGVGFATPKQLKQHLALLEEAKKRDHRKLGQELDLYVTSDLVGSGLPMFTPRGTVIREALADFSNELRQKRGFQKVWTPHITKKELYETSGHWAKFGDELFLVTSQETSDQLALKPMNCPHHTRIYAGQPRSYRDLPVRYLETTTDYRDEKTGELGGLNRVRSLTQDDSHAFCRPDQIEAEIEGLMRAAATLYDTVGMGLQVRLSYRDESDTYLGSAELWASAQAQLKSAVQAVGLQYFEQDGEAAFYGPKIDFMATDALGRQHQLATVQLDFVQPERFDQQYAGQDGSPKRPVMIHCALLGSVERFMAVYIEHTAGRFPVWLAPEQIRLVTVNDEPDTLRWAETVVAKATEIGLRATMDDGNESVGKKIRSAETMKVPYTIVAGDKERAGQPVQARSRQDLPEQPAQPIDELLQVLAVAARERR